MVLMQKDGVNKFVADVFVDFYRKNGYSVAGEEIAQQEEVVEAVEVEQEEKFNCPHCDKEYATEAGLNRHIAQKHKTIEE